MVLSALITSNYTLSLKFSDAVSAVGSKRRIAAPLRWKDQEEKEPAALGDSN